MDTPGATEKPPLRVLILEDRADDAELMAYELQRTGLAPIWHRVETEAEFLAHLTPDLDVILADYALPQFDALQALQTVKQSGLDIPVVVITGSLSDEAAVACLKQGAADYLLKDRLGRLGEAVRRVLAERDLRVAAAASERALRESEARFRRLAEHAHDVIYRYEFAPRRGFSYVSPAAERVIGYTPEDLYADPDRLLAPIHPDDRPRFEAAIAGPERSGAPLTIRWIHRDGRTVWAEHQLVVLTDAAGVPVAIEGIARDVTERQLAEEALRQSAAELSATAERQHLLNEFARTISSTLDLDSIFGLIVHQVSTLLGSARCTIAQYDAATDSLRIVEAQPRTDSGPAPGTPIPLGDSPLGHSVRARRLHVVEDTQREPESPPPGADHDSRSFVAVPIRIGDTLWGTLNVGFDSTTAIAPERIAFLEAISAHLTVAIRNAELYTRLQAAHESLLQSQQQAIQQERLRALGQMASGIAHDFNNALVPVQGFSELMLSDPELLADPDQVRTFLELILTGARDAAQIVSRLREFYRAYDPHDVSAPVDLAQVIEQVISLTQPRWKDQAQARGLDIQIETNLDPVPPIDGDEPALRQALTNLILNAVDALPEGGQISISLRQAGESIEIEVQDTGVGMTDEVLARCLEPFFSTKGERGTGLGLLMVHGIIQRHQGSLAISSSPGAGTLFTIRLPIGTLDTRPPEAAASATNVRSLRVLLIDDEPLVRDVISRYLRLDGHQVEQAADGRAGLAAFRPGAFDLVITDRALPGLGGEQLAAAIKERSPDVPIIMITGFADLMKAIGEELPGVDELVGKPVSLAVLRDAIARTVPAAAPSD